MDYLPLPNQAKVHITPKMLIYTVVYSAERAWVSMPDRYNRNVYRDVNMPLLLFANILVSKEFGAYLRNRKKYIFVGDAFVDVSASRVVFRDMYVKSNLGARHVTNIICVHNDLFDGSNYNTTRYIIADNNTICAVLPRILRSFVEVPFLDKDMPQLINFFLASALMQKVSKNSDILVWQLDRASPQRWNEVIIAFYKQFYSSKS